MRPQRSTHCDIKSKMLVSVLTMLFLHQIAAAQIPVFRIVPKMDISGEVYSRKNKPLANVTIEIYEDDTLIRTTATESDGIYRAIALPPGVYTAVIYKNGFDSLTLTGLIVGSKPLIINIPLNKCRKYEEPAATPAYCNTHIFDIDNPTKITYTREEISNMPVR